MSYEQRINRHYGATDVCARILAGLAGAGIDTDALSRRDLAPFDEFHGGGLASTRALARFAGLAAGMHVLDVGSGVGGPARTLADEFGCRVTGLDLTEEFCRAATMLSERVGMADRVEFRHGNALAMPFDDAAFDVVWSQNSLMNIEDKARLLREVRRVLRPGGRFAFEAVMKGEAEGLEFPVMWSSTPELSFLVTPPEMRALLRDAGLEERAFEDDTPAVLEHARRRRLAIERDGPPPIGIGLLVPDDLDAKTRNGLRNYETGRAVTVRALCVRRAGA